MYVSPASCPPVARRAALTMAITAALAKHTADDADIAAYLMEGGPERYQENQDIVAEREAIWITLLADYVRMFADIGVGVVSLSDHA